MSILLKPLKTAINLTATFLEFAGVKDTAEAKVLKKFSNAFSTPEQLDAQLSELHLGRQHRRWKSDEQGNETHKPDDIVSVQQYLNDKIIHQNIILAIEGAKKSIGDYQGRMKKTGTGAADEFSNSAQTIRTAIGVKEQREMASTVHKAIDTTSETIKKYKDEADRNNSIIGHYETEKEFYVGMGYALAWDANNFLTSELPGLLEEINSWSPDVLNKAISRLLPHEQDTFDDKINKAQELLGSSYALPEVVRDEDGSFYSSIHLRNLGRDSYYSYDRIPHEISSLRCEKTEINSYIMKRLAPFINDSRENRVNTHEYDRMSYN